MTTTVYPTRLFGGRDLGVTIDDVAQTVSILGQSISIASLPAGLQSQFANAIAATPISPGGKAAFGGCNISRVVGDLLDNQPAWRSSVRAALSGYVDQQTMGGLAAGVDTFNR